MYFGEYSSICNREIVFAELGFKIDHTCSYTYVFIWENCSQLPHCTQTDGGSDLAPGLDIDKKVLGINKKKSKEISNNI